MFFEMLQRFYDWLGRQWSFVQNPADLLPHYTFPIRPSVNFDPYSWFFCASTREQLITDRTVNQSATRESCFDHGVLPEVEHDHFVYRFCHGNAYQWSCFSVIFLLRNCEYSRRRRGFNINLTNHLLPQCSWTLKHASIQLSCSTDGHRQNHTRVLRVVGRWPLPNTFIWSRKWSSFEMVQWSHYILQSSFRCSLCLRFEPMCSFSYNREKHDKHSKLIQ